MFYLEIDKILGWIDEHYPHHPLYNPRMVEVRQNLDFAHKHNKCDLSVGLCNCLDETVIAHIVDTIYFAGWNDARSMEYDIPEDECPNCYPKTLKSGDCEGPPNCL